MVCQPAEVVPIEAVVRGYLAGSAWKEYLEAGPCAESRCRPACARAIDCRSRSSRRPPRPSSANTTRTSTSTRWSARVGSGHPPTAGSRAESSATVVCTDTPPRSPNGRASCSRTRSSSSAWARARTTRTGRSCRGTSRAPDAPAAGPPAAELNGRLSGSAAPGRRGAHARLVAVLGCRHVPARPGPGQLRQAVRPRLARSAAVGRRSPPGPALPEGVVAGTRSRYIEAFERITGAIFDRYLAEDVIAR